MVLPVHYTLSKGEKFHRSIVSSFGAFAGVRVHMVLPAMVWFRQKTPCMHQPISTIATQSVVLVDV